MSNPLLQPWDAPYGLPPFATTRPEHFAPAFEAAFAEHHAELDAIASNPEVPDFDNTIAAFDHAGGTFRRIHDMFGNLCAAHTNAELEAAERELAPKLARHESSVYMNALLFARIDAVCRGAQIAPAQRDAIRG